MGPSATLPWRAAVALGALLGLCSCGAESREDAPRVMLVGIDAGDWLRIDPLIEAGRLPVLARLRRQGRTGVMRSEPPLLSPILWTTIATGRPPDEHGVLDFIEDRASGPAPVSAGSRRVPALWNLFSRARRPVAMVGWWATAPVEADVLGTMVSDQLAPQLTRAKPPDGTALSVAARERLLPLMVAPKDVEDAELAARVPVDAERLAAARRNLGTSNERFYEDPLAHLAAVVAATRTYTAMAETLLADRPSLLGVYFEAVDTVSHRFVNDPSLGEIAIASAYADVDAALARLVSRASPDTWVIVCSDHGFMPRGAGVREDPGDLAGPATAWHRPFGIVGAASAAVLSGRATGEKRDVSLVSPRDIAPSVLQAAGLPATTRMQGRIVPGLVPDTRREPALSPIEVPDASPPAPSEPGGADAEAVARLRALGYVGIAGVSLARLNLGEVLYHRGRLDAAAREVDAFLELHPDSLRAQLWGARIAADQGRIGPAMAAYEQALQDPGGDAVVALAALAARTGRVAEARRVLTRASAAPPAARHTAAGLLFAAEGRHEFAAHEFEAALASEPDAYEALSGLLDVRASQGRSQAALPFAGRALAAVPDSPRHLALVASLLLRNGRAADAAALFGRASALAPDGDSARFGLARALLAQHEMARALSALDEAGASAERSLLRGAAFAMLERWPEAAQAYRSALEATSQPDVELLNALAFAELKNGHRAEARTLFDRSLASKPGQPEIARLRRSLDAR